MKKKEYSKKEIEKIIKNGEDRFRAIFDSTFDGIFIHDKGIILDVNQTTASMTGYEPGELAGRKILDFVAEECRDDILQKLAIAIKNPNAIFGPYEAVGLDKNGRRFNIEIYSKSINYKDKIVRLVSFRDITARKIAEEELKKSEERFRELVEGTDDLSTRVDSKGRFIYVNHTAEKIFGIPADKCIGQSAFNFVHLEDREITQKNFNSWIREKLTNVTFENRQVSKNGDVFNMLWSIKLCYDENGEVSGINSIARDITIRKQAEKTLLESEESFRTLFDSTFEGIFIYEKGIIIEANHTAESMLRYEPGEMEGLNVLNIIAEASRDDIIQKLSAVAENPFLILGPYETTSIRKDGTKFYVEVHSKGLNYKGKVVRLVSFRDITERKKAEKSLLNSEERLELALIGGDIGLWDWNVKTGECYFDQRWTEMLGYAPGEIEPHNKSWEKILHPDDKPEVLKKLNAHFEDETVLYEVEMRLRTKSEKWKWILGKGKVVERDENGMPLRMTGTHLDITERKKMEELLRESEERLRKMNDVLVSIAKSKTVISGDLDAAFEEITEAAVNTLEVEWSSIWLLDEEEGTSQCFDSFQRSTGEHAKGVEIKGSNEESSEFIELFKKSRTIAVNDISLDPLCKAFCERHFPESNTTSKIWAPIRSSGKNIGVLSIDHKDSIRKWTLEEQNFAGSLADIISIAIETTERLDAEKVLQNKIAFQDLIAQISTEFINLSPMDFDIGINNVLQNIGEFAGADRSYVFVFKNNNTKMDNTHEWCAEGIEPQIKNLKDIDVESLPWWMEKLNKFENIHIPSVDELPEEARTEKEILQAQNIKSLLVVPLRYYNSLYGFIGFDSVRMVKYWFTDSIRLLETVGTTITKALEHKRIHEELRKINEELEKKVEERTRELREKQAQLAQSEKMASLGNLVAGIAHEINTPLGALKSNNDIFIRSIEKMKSLLTDRLTPEDTPKDKALAKLFANIEKLSDISETAAERIMKIVKSLRTFARLDQAEMDTVDIHEGIESTLTLVHHEIKRRIEVLKDYADIPKISCYPNQLNQVFMNILVNASQAIEDKGDIYIKTYVRDNNAIIEFRDTGKGIPEENLKHIFDPGFTTKSKGIGTGLGLSIVYQIVQDHKGKIEVESGEDKGTFFRIVLPI